MWWSMVFIVNYICHISGFPGVHQPFSQQIFSAIETAEKEIVKKEIVKLNFSPCCLYL